MTSERRYDVIVVGGGPAASGFALSLAHRAPGLAARTLLLERCQHPREKYCAGAVSSVGLELLRAYGWTLDVPWVSIDGVRVRYGDYAASHRRPGMGVVIRRSEFDASLWHAAGRAGVTLHDGERVTGLDRDMDGTWIVRTDRDRYRARVVIGADGTGSAVRKLAGFPEPRRKGRLYVLETEPRPSEEDSRLLDFDLSCIAEGIQGYYWDFPTVMHDRPAVSRGIYHLNARPRPDLKRVLEGLLDRRGLGARHARIKPFSERGFTPSARMSCPGLMLVGEAAGIDPVTGEGIAQALVYADVAARECVRGLERGNLAFTGYRRAMKRTTMAQHLRQSAWMAPQVYGRRARTFASFLATRPDAVAAGARWYEGRPLGKAEMLRLGTAVTWSLAKGEELPAP